MRIAASALALLIDVGILVLGLVGLFAGDPDAPLLIFVAASVAFGILAAAILLQLLRRSNRALRLAALHLCWLVPVAWLVGSLDHGIVSGLEILSLGFVAIICGINFAALRLGPPSHA